MFGVRAILSKLNAIPSPRLFGFLRSRWCCEAVALLILRVRGVAVSRETVRRWLHSGGIGLPSPAPILGPKDPDRQAKLDALRGLLAGLPADETAVFQDEVDINTNPKIGSMWIVKGQQATVDLHDRITRNHPCQSMEELLDLTFGLLRGRDPFKVEDKVYRAAT